MLLATLVLALGAVAGLALRGRLLLALALVGSLRPAHRRRAVDPARRR